VLVTQMDLFHRLLGTVDINAAQFLWAMAPAIALLILWELGKLIVRMTIAARHPARPAAPPETPAAVPAAAS
ncbi:MAG: hypothetical protein AB7V44_31390, partial [Pseudonocardia sp.]